MSDSHHTGSEELALYVIGALDAEGREAVERHVLSCEACAEGLAREARVEAALEQVAVLASRRVAASVSSIVPAIRSAGRHVRAGGAAWSTPERARLVSGGRGSRWAGGVAGALASAAAIVLVLASTTAHSEPAVGIAQRAPALHDAAGDMSGAFGGEVVLADSLDGG